VSGTIDYISRILGSSDDLRRDVVLQIASSFLKSEHGLSIPPSRLSIIEENNVAHLVSAEGGLVIKITAGGVPELVPNRK
jgi:hypothetical protein